MSKTKSHKAKPHRKTKHSPKPRKNKPDLLASLNPDCPYRPTSLYGVLFLAGNTDYIPKDQLLKTVSEKTGKPLRSVSFAFEVLKNQHHRSNGGRSSLLEENGKVKLIALKQRPTSTE